ncbi:fibronectin type III domain-containing protein [Granulosicoccus sp. 3-233]|uniref:VCBS repeat-containing protein n=1 Tax=Granulosicoccus sp. 3-233 TaxID=3417969 RepID=UPI003D33D37C
MFIPIIRSAGLALLTCGTLQAATFPSTFEPMRMSADEGWVFSGESNTFNFASQAVSLGDINGDGLADIALGTDIYSDTGGIYIIPGGPQLQSMQMTPDSIASAGGTYIPGVNEISALGDFNGDGLDDWLLSSRDYNDGAPSGAVIVLGRRTPYPTPLDISTLDSGSSMSLTFNGAPLTPYYTDESSVLSDLSLVGDINGDGRNDLAVFSRVAAIEGQSILTMVLGTEEPLPATLDLTTVPESWQSTIRFAGYMDGSDIIWSAFFGMQNVIVDANADGLDDLLFGDNGTKYLIFGSADGLPEMIDFQSLDGSNGTTLLAYDTSGLPDPIFRYSQSILYGDPVDISSDCNADGRLDLVFNSYDTVTYDPFSIVLYGRSDAWPAELNLQELPEAYGRFTEETIWTFNGIGDINGDGLEERSQNNYVGVEVIYGGVDAGFGSVALNGINGFTISGTVDSVYIDSVTGLEGDFNGDGLNDLLIGSPGGYDPGVDIDALIDSPYADEFYQLRTGVAYIIFGREDSGAPASPWQAYPALAPDSIELRWEQSAAADIAGFEIIRDELVIGTPGPEERSFEVPDATRYNRQTYQLITIDAAGERSSPLFLSVNNNIDNFPELGGEVYSDTLAEIFWVFYNREYDIYRDGVKVDRLQAQSWLDTLYDAQEHTYRIETIRQYFEDHVLRSTLFTLPAQTGTRPPAAVTGLSFALYSEHTLELFWEPAAWGTPPLSYEIRESGRPLATTSGTSLMDYDIYYYGGYDYEIVTVDGNGRRSAPANLFVSVYSALAEIRPAMPVNLSSIALSETSIQLEWEPSDIGTPATGYDIYSYETHIGRTSDTRFNIDGLAPDTIHHAYQVVAFNDDGQQSEWNYFPEVSTAGGPTAPASAEAIAYGPHTAELFWSRVEFNATPVSGYDIYRDDVLIDTVSSISYMDYALDADTAYRYTVYSVSDTGVRSQAFATALVQTPAN